MSETYKSEGKPISGVIVTIGKGYSRIHELSTALTEALQDAKIDDDYAGNYVLNWTLVKVS